mmetsp:Transcript_1408/g.3064  ORF Transcript_1408/g.3064 Transcript_1408/m.3064 type:complete len:158 (-) Transcript_1408:802-1275(-)
MTMQPTSSTTLPPPWHRWARRFRRTPSTPVPTHSWAIARYCRPRIPLSITTRHMVKAVSALLLLVFKRLPRYSKGEMADGQEWVWPKWIRYSFGVSDGLQVFFNTGLLGAIITTIFSSLIWPRRGFVLACTMSWQNISQTQSIYKRAVAIVGAFLMM